MTPPPFQPAKGGHATLGLQGRWKGGGVKKIIWLVCFFAFAGCAPQTVSQRDPRNWSKMIQEFESLARDTSYGEDLAWHKLANTFVALAKRGHEKTFSFLFQLGPEVDARAKARAKDAFAVGWALSLGGLYNRIYDQRPELFNKVLSQEPKEVRGAVEYLKTAADDFNANLCCH